jgi:hypothetical protein
MNCIEIEVAVAEYFNPRTNLIVPNVSWGMFLHECDLLVLTPSGYAYEIEIKTSKQDLIKDLDKPHKHDSKKIKKLYFAIPSKLVDCISYIPERAGVIIINEETRRCKKIREAKVWNNYKFSDSDRYMLARLGSMRIWNLKQKLAASIRDRRNDRKFNYSKIDDILNCLEKCKNKETLIKILNKTQETYANLFSHN